MEVDVPCQEQQPDPNAYVPAPATTAHPTPLVGEETDPTTAANTILYPPAPDTHERWLLREYHRMLHLDASLLQRTPEGEKEGGGEEDHGANKEGRKMEELGRLHKTSQVRTDQVLSRTLSTVETMLKDRGYSHVERVQDTKARMKDVECVVRGTNPEGETIEVFFSEEERVGVKCMRSLLDSSPADKIVIVSVDGPTAFTRKEASSFLPRVQFFLFSELAYVVVRHVLVPLHEKLTEEETKRLPFDPLHCPKLLSSDAISQYYAYEPGDVIRITRTVGVPEPTFHYRRVVQAP